MRQAARRSVASGRSGAAVCLSREHVKRVEAPASARRICTSATFSSSGDSNVRQYVSLYNYTDVDATELPYLRRRVLAAWREMHVTGRVYLAEEGINAQLTLPENRLQAFATSFPRLFGPEHMYLGARISDDTAHSSPFKALSVRIKHQLVADGFERGHLDLRDSGNALPPDQWHNKLRQHLTPKDPHAECNSTVAGPDASKSTDSSSGNSISTTTTTNNNNNIDDVLLLDVRNFYEHEVGRFDGATRIMVDTFRDTFDAVDEILAKHEAAHDGEKPREVMMYCTGGIRCEKVGAYLKQYKGIDTIHKLQGGIVNYQRFLKEHPDEPSLFKGKNFVFDQRCVAGAVGGAGAESEVLTEDVLGTCFQCGEPCNDHTNCSNLMCGGLILLCPTCRVALLGACSDACREEVKKMRDMTGPALRTYRKEHASKWHYNVPNALSRLQYRASARGFSSSAFDSSSSEDRLDLNTYVFQMSSPLEDEALLQELRDATQREWPKSEQLIDAPQGKALGSLVALVGAKHVLEVGCFTGYSAMCLASGLPKGDSASSVTTCDIDEATMAFAKDFFTRSSRREQLHAVVSDGLEFLDQCSATGRTFDLIFVDANKRQYRNYFDLILEKRLLRPNGLLVFDNTLFRGRVLAHVNGDAHKKERIARGLADFNAYVASDPRVTSVLLPLWDGLTLVRWASSSAQPDNA
ncbi:hypothetical protein ATCC90586_004282 [Pythium insidiosum]|nr:hypothetical protein ATCC90586_004282 [Pythium insidiosum]